MSATPDQVCGCGAVLTSERKWSAHIADGCQLAGRPRPETCRIEDCGKPRRGRDLCPMHASRLDRTGRLDRKTAAERLWEQVDRSGECWEWTGRLTAAGYGRLSVDKRPTLAHRFSYELLVGPVPDDLPIDHLCRNRRCVNPEHLEIVTTGENNRRAWVIRRENAGLPPLGCGNMSGYSKHRADGTTPCDACREARRLDQRAKTAGARASREQATDAD